MNWDPREWGNGWNWGGAAQGAGGGALAGAAFGGPLGAGIGALAGGIVGGFGEHQNPYQQQMEQWTRQQALSRGPAAQGSLSGFRGNQQDLVRMLEAQARGEGPSLAGQQLREATDRNARTQQAMAAGTGGPNAALAQFQAAQMGNMGAAQNAQAAMAGRIQEQYNAQNQLGLTLHGARGMDEQMSLANAGMRNDRDSENLQAGLANRGMQFGALSTLYGNEAGKPGLGETILGAGAGLYAFKAGQTGAGGGSQQAPGPTPQMWGPPGMGYGGWAQGGPAPGYGYGYGVPSGPPGQPRDPYADAPGGAFGQPRDPYGQLPTSSRFSGMPSGWWGQGGY